ncbi:MAG: FAD-dependent oxidoreductase [Ignavibacteriales bacterium]|nr:FAD-dependent oxidoreductase [Ignavibacteriales bacterium]
MSHDVIVVGAGLAGLSAAVDLSLRGHKVLVLEQRPKPGGRTYSFVDETTGDVVDNGQHLLMGCYYETRLYLREIGSDSLATLQPGLQIDFLHPEKGMASLACPPLPAPMHILAGLFQLRTLTFADRLKLLRVGVELQWTSTQKERRLERMTVEEWLVSLGQSDQNRKYLWDIIAIGTLNDKPDSVSALLFFRVLRTAFLGSRENSCLLIPRCGLSELLVDPAVRYIQSRGGAVKTGHGVTSLKTSGDRVVKAVCEEGSHFESRAFISAVPHYALPAILDGKASASAGRFQSSPIITINLWLDREILENEFLALLDSRIQWIFNKSRLFGKSKRTAGQYLALVMSGAEDFVGLDKNILVDIAMEDLGRAIPATNHAKVIHSLVVKEKRATFSPKPGTESLRPSATTNLVNLFLAGDWTNTGFPATIEGAVISGRKAAQLASATLM